MGCGRWGRLIVRDLVSLGCRVTVVARSEASRRRAAESGAAGIVGRADDLPPADGIVVATPSATHGEIVESLLDRGVPLFIEKPMTCDVASARRIVARAGARVFVMHKWRYHPGIEALREIAAGGELGPVEGLRLVQADWGNPHGDTDVAWILLPHCLSIALHVLGRLPEPRAAVAEAPAGATSCEGMVALLAGPPWVSIEVSSRFFEKVRWFRLVCREGVAELDDGYTDHIRVARGGETHRGAKAEIERRRASGEMPLLAELREFVEHLRGGPPPRCGAAEGLEVVEAIAALRRHAGIG